MSPIRHASIERGVCLRARLVVPVAGPPLENGAVAIRGSRVTRVARWDPRHGSADGSVVDLGEVMLLPGLINAHCHLDYTRMAGQLPRPRRFTDWIQSIVTLKAGWSQSDYAVSWQDGARMLLESGTTTVADMEAVPELVPGLWQDTPLRVVSFREMIHMKDGPEADQLVREAVTQWAEVTGPGEAGRLGLSPHAPYSTTERFLQQAAREARARGWLLSTHVAESEEEFNMFRHGRGPLYDWLRSQRSMNDCGQRSVVRHLAALNYLGPDLLAVHVNYLDPGDADLLARHQVSVVHCPRSHAYFQHHPFPWQALSAAGVNLCLGTDSLATVTASSGRPLRLSLFEEMRLLGELEPGLAPGEILRMATVNGAQALGRAGELGALTPGALADLAVVPYAGRTTAGVDVLVYSAAEVTACMVGGVWSGAEESWPGTMGAEHGKRPLGTEEV